MMTFRFVLATVTCVAAVAFGWTVQAEPILNQSQLSEGGSPQTVNDIAIEAFTDEETEERGTFAQKTVGSGETAATGMGIEDGTIGEVGSPSGQAMVFDFTARAGGAIDLEHLQIAFLYPDGEFNDDGNEVAEIEIAGADEDEGHTLSVTAEDTTLAAIDDGLGSSATNLLIAQEPQGGGLWQLDFSGDSAFDGVTRMTLRSGAPGPNSEAADFSFVEVAEVPAPATLALLGTGLIGLGALARRRWRI